MKTQFYDIEEARAEVKRLTEKTNPKYFCPLINGQCRKDCWCIGTPRIVSNQCGYGETPTAWSAYPWWCSNKMFGGGE